MKYQREILNTLLARIQEPRRFIQVIAGPRQVGKTTIAISLQEVYKGFALYYSADDVPVSNTGWIDGLWESLRVRMKLEDIESAVLIIDEIQKIDDWSSVVKKNWDRDSREKTDIKLILLGSSRLLLMDGLSESLMGRFELLYAGHWSLTEMQKAFGFTPQEYLWYGGYPGAAALIEDEVRFKEYVRNSIIEPTMMRDILLTTKVDKPALLRQLLEIGIKYSTKIVSYNKLLGQLQDAGNTTTLARYLKLLEQAGLLSGLNKYSGSVVMTKGTIPKFQIHNPALFSALEVISFHDALANQAYWGSISESCVGAHLVSQANRHTAASLYYWREHGNEIDYVVVYGNDVIGIEVKNGDEGISEKTEKHFKQRFPQARIILIGKHGLPYEVFLKTELPDLFG